MKTMKAFNNTALEQASVAGHNENKTSLCDSVGFKFYFPDTVIAINRIRSNFDKKLDGIVENDTKQRSEIHQEYFKSLEMITDKLLEEADGFVVPRVLCLSEDVKQKISANLEKYVQPGGLISECSESLVCLHSGQVGKAGDVFLRTLDGSSDAILFEFCTENNVVENGVTELVILV